MSRLRFSAWVLVAASLTAAACGGDPASEESSERPTRAEVVTGLVDSVMRPGVDAALDAGTEFATAVDAACAAPTTDSVAAARAALAAGWRAWQTTDPYDLGPAMERRSTSVLGFEADPFGIDKRLAAATPSDPATIRNRTGSGLRGYAAAHHLLIGDAAAYDAVRCGYVGAVAAVIVEELEAIRAGWSAGLDGEPQSVIDDLVNMSLADLEASDKRLTAILESGEAAPLELPAGELFRIAARLDGLAAVLEGGGDEPGLAALLNGGLANELDDTLTTAQRALETYAEAPQDTTPDRVELRAIRDALGDLRTLMSTEVVSGLGVTVGFSDNDGDS